MDTWITLKKSEFTREQVPASVGRSVGPVEFRASVQEANEAFTGFTYVPPTELD